MPVAVPPLKEAEGDPGPDVRLELCRAAVAGEEGVEVSDLEVARGGASYTVDTLRELHASHPEHDLTFITGADAAASLSAWREPAKLLELARVAVADRAGEGKAEVQAATAGVPGARERIVHFAMPRLDVSSTQVRAAVAAGEPIDGLVPAGVAELIERRGLYREPVSA
jgi:nicotinate-nucleotide adenylyltransferase